MAAVAESIHRAVAADPMHPDLYTIRQVRKETHDTFTLGLVPSAGGRVPSFAPGQFNMLYVFGAGEVPISISGDPGDRSTLVHTIRQVGTVTQALRQLKRGGHIGVRGPYGTAWPVAAATGKDVVIIAGGIGLAPLRPAICHVLAHREQYGQVVVLYGARTPDDILFARDLEDWRGRFDVHAFVTVDRASGPWRGHVGVVTSLIPQAPFDPAHCLACVCGPEIMMRFTALELEKRGVPPESIVVSMERNMKCGLGLCGHCQWGPHFICKDGPVFNYARIRGILMQREI